MFDNDDLTEQTFTYTTLFRFPSILKSIDKPGLKIADLCWNCKGNVLAVAYFIDDHIGPCAHSNYICFFKFSHNALQTQFIAQSSSNVTPYESVSSLETNACISSLDSHPTLEHIFVAGSFIGEVYYINIANDALNKDMVEHISTIDSMFYKERVMSVKFVKYDLNTYYIVSISEEGRILLWNPADKLQYPVQGFNLKFSINKTTLPINPSCFCTSTYDSFEYLIGTFDGNIYKCKYEKPTTDSGSVHDYIFMDKKGVVWREKVRTLIANMKEKEILEMKKTMERICLDKGLINLDINEFYKLRPDVNKVYKNALKAHFEKHFSVVTSINYNTFIKNLFITTSYDGTLRVYNGELSGSRCLFQSTIESAGKDDAAYYTCSCWSPYKPSLYAYGNSEGEVGFDVVTSKNCARKVCGVNYKGSGSVVKVLFNNNESLYKNVFMICYEDGIVEVGMLSEAFSRVGNNEIEKLYKVSKL